VQPTVHTVPLWIVFGRSCVSSLTVFFFLPGHWSGDRVLLPAEKPSCPAHSIRKRRHEILELALVQTTNGRSVEGQLACSGMRWMQKI